jgi:hypothetical protein
MNRHVEPARYPALASFLRGYLHEDFATEHGSPAAAAAAFRQAATPTERRRLASDWARFRSGTQGLLFREVVRQLTQELGSAWAPRSWRALDTLFARLEDR